MASPLNWANDIANWIRDILRSREQKEKDRLQDEEIAKKGGESLDSTYMANLHRAKDSEAREFMKTERDRIVQEKADAKEKAKADSDAKKEERESFGLLLKAGIPLSFLLVLTPWVALWHVGASWAVVALVYPFLKRGRR